MITLLLASAHFLHPRTLPAWPDPRPPRQPEVQTRRPGDAWPAYDRPAARRDLRDAPVKRLYLAEGAAGRVDTSSWPPLPGHAAPNRRWHGYSPCHPRTRPEMAGRRRRPVPV